MLLVAATLTSAVNILLMASPRALAKVQVNIPSFLKLQTATPGTQQVGHANISGTLIAGQFKGNGSQVTNLDAGNLATGTVPDARIGSNIPRLAATNTWPGVNNFTNSLNSFTGNGQLLTNLNASNFANGIVPNAQINVGGDIFGPLTASKVVGLRGKPISTTVPTVNQVLGFDGTQWTPRADGLTLPFSQTVNVANGPIFSVENNGLGDAMGAWASGGGCGLSVASGSTLLTQAGTAVCATSDIPGGYALFGNAVPESTGGRFVRLDIYADMASPTGAMRTNGYLWKDYTQTKRAVAVPIAYGSVSAGGSVAGGTGNFSVVRSGTGQFDVTVSGETYSDTNYVVTVTPVSTSDRHACVTDQGVAFRVSMFNQAGVLTDNQFQFTVWAMSPVKPG